MDLFILVAPVLYDAFVLDEICYTIPRGKTTVINNAVYEVPHHVTV